ncbi:unnamed protein product, partial [Musa acuminata var. zebrina]
MQGTNLSQNIHFRERIESKSVQGFQVIITSSIPIRRLGEFKYPKEMEQNTRNRPK